VLIVSGVVVVGPVAVVVAVVVSPARRTSLSRQEEASASLLALLALAQGQALQVPEGRPRSAALHPRAEAWAALMA
jgi:hypothetical protein